MDIMDCDGLGEFGMLDDLAAHHAHVHLVFVCVSKHKATGINWYVKNASSALFVLHVLLTTSGGRSATYQPSSFGACCAAPAIFRPLLSRGYILQSRCDSKPASVNQSASQSREVRFLAM